MDLVYIAQPIDQAIEGTLTFQHVADARFYLAKLGAGSYSPASAFTVRGVAPDPIVDTINRIAMWKARHLLAFLPKGVPTLGVPAEIEYATHIGIPVLIVTDQDGSSFQVAAWGATPGVRVVSEVTLESMRWLLKEPGQYNADAPRPIDLPVAYTGGYNMEMDVPRLPERSYRNDAGLDLVCSIDTVCRPGEYTDVPVGVAVGFPAGCWGMIVGRSSTTRKRGLLVSQGVIDPGYRGELFVGVYNPALPGVANQPAMVEAGERIGQLLLFPSMTQYKPRWVPQDQLPLPEDGRGLAGFGSSGK